MARASPQPKTRAHPRAPGRPRSAASSAAAPALSPSCPRPDVTPPRNRSAPSASKSSTSPDVVAPKRLASSPPGSRTRRAPGSRAAIAHVGAEVTSPPGSSRNTTRTAARGARDTTRSSSRSVARVQGHRGCTKHSSVLRPGSRAIALPAGQRVRVATPVPENDR